MRGRASPLSTGSGAAPRRDHSIGEPEGQRAADNHSRYGIAVETIYQGRQEAASVKASMLDRWSQKIQQLRNRSFLETAMAAAALVSTADEDVRLSEQLALDRVLERLDRLRVFDPHEGVELHRRYAASMIEDPIQGRLAAIQALVSFDGSDEECLLILYVGAVIAKADQVLSDPEQVALAEICQALALPVESSLERIWQTTGGPAEAGG
jgi:tellurite resistance protein TerB